MSCTIHVPYVLSCFSPKRQRRSKLFLCPDLSHQKEPQSVRSKLETETSLNIQMRIINNLYNIILKFRTPAQSVLRAIKVDHIKQLLGLIFAILIHVLLLTVVWFIDYAFSVQSVRYFCPWFYYTFYTHYFYPGHYNYPKTMQTIPSKVTQTYVTLKLNSVVHRIKIL